MPKKRRRPSPKRNPRPINPFDRFLDVMEQGISMFVDNAVNALLSGTPGLPTLPRPGASQSQSPPQSSAQPPSKLPNFYDELEVSPLASPETITAAYRSLSKRLHPDLNKSKSAAERIRKVNEAYEVLGDGEKRRKYDAVIRRIGR